MLVAQFGAIPIQESSGILCTLQWKLLSFPLLPHFWGHRKEENLYEPRQGAGGSFLGTGLQTTTPCSWI